MQISITFTDNEMASIRKVLSSRCFVALTDEQIVDFFTAYPGLAGTIKEAGGAGDTMEREYLRDRFAQYLLGDDAEWPYNGSSKESSDTFFKNYIRAIQDHGLVLDKEAAKDERP